MQVGFYKADRGRLCGWTAAPPKRKRFQGTTMASGRYLPHDLAQFVVEKALGLDCGFWGLLAKGATFKSVPGRRPTRPGREIIRAHGGLLDRAEDLVNVHVNAWRAGAATPVGAALEAMLARWRALPLGEALHLEWPTRTGGGRRTKGGAEAGGVDQRCRF